MIFKKETDVEAVKNVALTMLYEEPERKENGLVNHAFISDEETNLNGVIFNIFENVQLWNEWQENRAKIILSLELDTMIYMITAPYRLYFFEEIIEYLSQKDFSRYLAEFYTHSEFTGIMQESILEWFESANKDYVMYETERVSFEKLPDEITIYRGTKTLEGVNGLSWTLDKKIARAFSKRFSKEGYIYKAKVDKKDILAYFDRREEEEVIINPDNIYDVKLLKK